MTLREVLHAHIPTLTTESTIRDAVDKMDIYQFPALVITNDLAKPIGVITEGDVCRVVSNRESVTSIARDPAYAHSSKEPTCAHPDMEIGEAFHLMLNSGLTILPIVEEERMIGVTLRTDLMQAMLVDSVQGER